MRVLIIANSDIGLYKFRKELLEELVKTNEVYMSLPNGKYIKELMKLGVRFIECELLDRHGTNPIREIQLLSYYKKMLKEYKPNIVFTYTIKCNAYGGIACANAGIPYVANVTGLGTAVENKGLMQKITLSLYKAGLKKAQKVFFQNVANRDFMLKHGVINGPYDVLPGSGVNLNQYKVTEYPNGKTIDFLFIARVMKEKGIDQYLEMAKYIRRKYPQTRFHVCGFCEQAYEEKLDEYQEKGYIQYHGLVDNIAEMQKISSCTVHPTYYPEGMSNVLLESCACGRPIITTNRPGCREVVEDGVNGYIVREKDSQDLIEKVERFLSKSVEERKQMGLAARRKVENEFNRKLVIDKYLAEMEKI